MMKEAKAMNKLREHEAIYLIREELGKAEMKFPRFPVDPIHAASLVAEEAGELVQATLQATYDNISIEKAKKEAIHTGATALRFLINLDNYITKPDQV